MARPDRDQQPFFESGHFRKPEEVARLFIVPETPDQIPHILGYVSPARSGSTAFGLLMASHPKVDRSYFQPWKYGLRHGGQTIIYPNDSLIVMKETLGPLHQEEIFDPIDILLMAGVPKEKITFIVGLRNPINTVASLEHFVPGGMNVEYFAQMQAYIIEIFNKYRSLMGGRIIPFSFDLLAAGEEMVLKRLLEKTGLGIEEGLKLDFDREALGVDNNWKLDPNSIKGKMVWGEATNPTYFEEAVYPTIRQGKFHFVSRTTNTQARLSPEKIEEVKKLCMDNYIAFHRLAASELSLSV